MATEDDKVSLNVQIPAPLKADLEQAAIERHFGLGKLVEIALNEFLADLIPVEELQLTRRRASAADPPVTPRAADD